MKPFRWGIFGTGAISAKFAAGLASAQNAEVGFIASRSLDKAQRFATSLGIPRAIEGYEAAAAAAAECGVDAVYIATPPSKHAAHALYCIAMGLPVLVEKPFAMTAEDARRVAEAARTRGVFAMEAMWTRFLPAAQALRKRLAAAAVGEVRLVAGNFGTSQIRDGCNGMFDVALGGGALSHLASYPLSLSQWLFGTPTIVQAVGRIGPTGVDEDVAFQMRFPSGVTGSFFASLQAWAPDDFQVLGSHGTVAFKGSIVRPRGLALTREAPLLAEATGFGLRARMRQHGWVHHIAQRFGRSSRGQLKELAYHYGGNGYHYEADEVRACVERGALQSIVMPLDDSIAVAATIDNIRHQVHASVGARNAE